jgi:NAD(P) transhydrogenase subunit alpha
MSKEFIDAEMALFRRQAAQVDIIITTALIPGRPAPKLIEAETVAAMKPGSVIVDLAVEQGGNCELTKPGEAVVAHGVTIIGYTDLPSRMAPQASQLYAANLRNLLTELCPARNGEIVVDMNDEVVRAATVVHAGRVTWPPPRPEPPAVPPVQRSEPRIPATAPAVSRRPSWLWPAIALAGGALLLALIGGVAPPEFLGHFTVFVLACFVGYMVVWNVTPSLHTPLMSVTNAISSIVIVGALLQIDSADRLIAGLAAFVVLLTAINIFGGFGVTRRMLAMFRK